MNRVDDEDFEDMEDEELFDGDQNKDLMDQNLVDENRKYLVNNGGYPGVNDREEMEQFQQQTEGADDIDNSSVEDDDNQNVYEEQKVNAKII